MPCMEVWGGNQAVDCGVVMSGVDAWLYSRPFRGETGGGDVHYVSSCATGRITRVLVADVSGHGSAVSEVGATLRLLMRRYVNHLDQTRFVVALNNEFGALAQGGRFATSVVGTFFAPNNLLTVSNAGHPPPLLYRSREKSWSLVRRPESEDAAANVPLGILEHSRYGQQSVQLRVGDLVLCYTDSLIEALGADGRMLGLEGLLEIARSLDPKRPENLIPSLLEAVSSPAEGNLQGDDVTVLLLRPNGMAPRAPVAERVKAPFRIMGGLARSLHPGGTPPWPELSLPAFGGAIFSPLNRLWKGGRRGRGSMG